MHDWTPTSFLESAENLKARLKALTGRTPSTSLAREIAVCLQQGRLFYESADRSGIEIRPLLLFYGTLAFAKALVMGRTLQSLATLPQSHGLKDVSPPTARVSELAVRIESAGTFQRFNDVAAQLNRLEYTDHQSMTRSFILPTALSLQLTRKQFTMRDVLSRIPGLEGIYLRTFNESANTESVSPLRPSHRDETYWELRIDDRNLFTDRAGLKQLVRKWRDRFPVLEALRVVEAVRAWDNAIILFGNVAVPPNELDGECLAQHETGYEATDRPERNAQVPRLSIQSVIGPHGGSFAGSRSLVAPKEGLYVSKHSLHYLGMFMLSSLVRYRPQTWVHSISRTATAQRPPDDQALTLLEQFMSMHAGAVVTLIGDAFAP